MIKNIHVQDILGRPANHYVCVPILQGKPRPSQNGLRGRRCGSHWEEEPEAPPTLDSLSVGQAQVLGAGPDNGHTPMAQDSLCDGPGAQMLGAGLEEGHTPRAQDSLCDEQGAQTLGMGPEEGWALYWAQQGSSLLWQTWLETHPQYCSDQEGALWDCPDSSNEWELHYIQTYERYWEEYRYWTSQGWTMAEAQEGAGPALVDTPSADNGDPVIGGAQRAEEEVADLIGQLSLKSLAGREVIGSQIGRDEDPCCLGDEPCDGGNRKRTSSSRGSSGPAGKRTRPSGILKRHLSVFICIFVSGPAEPQGVLAFTVTEIFID